MKVFGGANRWYEGRSAAFRRGAALLIVMGVLTVGLFFKSQIMVKVRGGETIEVEFAQNYSLKEGKTKVKVAGIEVGVVQSVDQSETGVALVKLKVDEETLRYLGSEPTAEIEPLTLLGGEYSVNLGPGGAGRYAGDRIPIARSAVPVELDRILEALPQDTRTSLRGTVKYLDTALANGGGRSLKRLAAQAPETLAPGGRVLDALRGTRPKSDLSGAVRDLGRISSVLSARNDDLASIVEDADVVSSTLADHRGDLAVVLGQLPDALRETRVGMASLRSTLAKVDHTADDIRPAVRELDDVVAALDPALEQLEPLLADARPLIRDAVPTVDKLPAIVTRADRVLGDVRGPVLDRLRGPILDQLGSTWRGKGEYRYSGGGLQAENKMYEEIAYMVTNIARVSAPHDAQGAMLNFQASVGASSLAPLALDDLLGALAGQVSNETKAAR